MTRLNDFFADRDHKALVTFITAGDPIPEVTVPALHAIVAAGADVLELGIPFSDPEAEGPAIQASSERALANGVTLSQVLSMVREFRETNQSTPVVLMGYLNSILAMPDFPSRAGEAGVDGLIMVNLPPEEAQILRKDLHSNQIDLIFLVAPTTTTQRREWIFSQAQGFVYYVSLKGPTGTGQVNVTEVADKLGDMRRQTDLPLCVGFGIKDGQTAGLIGAHADGVVVGSALVNLMGQGGSTEQICERLTQAVVDLRQGLDHPA